MPAALTHPGVYIEEIPSGVRTITGVSTSVALFVGRASQGPLTRPTLCLSYSDFVRTYSADIRYGDLARSVKLFFDNGGTQCHVLRIASGAAASSVTLQTESGAPSLILTAKNAGIIGDTLRAAVTYNGQQPEATFNLELFRWETDATGRQIKKDAELWQNLSMDDQSRRFAPTFLTQSSKLVDAALPGGAKKVTPSATGFSRSMRPIAFQAGVSPITDLQAFNTTWTGALDGGSRFQISVDGAAFREIDLSILPALAKTTLAELPAELAENIAALINARLPFGKVVTVAFVAGPLLGGIITSLLQIASANGDVLIQPVSSPDADLASRLMLGTPQGGLEVSRFAAARPAPNGLTFMVLSADYLQRFSIVQQKDVARITVDGKALVLSLVTTAAAGTDPMIKDARTASKNGNNDGIREKLGLLVAQFNKDAPGQKIPWRAELWGLRLAFLTTADGDNNLPIIKTEATELAGYFNKNVRYATLGTAGTRGLQTPGTAGSDGISPTSADYDAAYALADKEIDLFNLLVLPADAERVTQQDLWGAASTFCARRRAMLLIDAPTEWDSAAAAVDLSTGVSSLRMGGLAKANSALFYPSLLIDDGGIPTSVGPSGAIAGLMARIDASRGVWKAPAGMEADLRGVLGLSQRFTDAENGVLNPRGINTLRVFPSGAVNWGARTMDGDDDLASEWKYIPVRRLALFLEESLFRGTKWAVFEPNDEPLWSQLRLNLGSFMHGLFRQGAFQGKTPREAYFVKCDRETTTQDDINHGVVNILVGFAPLKPAEFVVIQLQQMAGQLQA